jgi:hypothetical protein
VNSAVNKIGNIIDGGVDAFKAFSNGDAAGGIGSVVGAVNSAILPPAPFSSSAVSPDTNGYTEIEELSKFFYLYNKLKSKHSGDWALYFKNYRSNQMWRCIVNGFSIQRMAQQPYLYRYQIQLQAWDVKGIKNTSQATMDRFGPGGDLAAVNTVSMQSYGKLHNMALKTTSKSKSGGGMFLSPGGNIL